MFSFEIDLSAIGEDRTPDVQKFICYFVPIAVRLKDAVSGQLDWIAAGHHVDQNPAVAQPVERCGKQAGDEENDKTKGDL